MTSRWILVAALALVASMLTGCSEARGTRALKEDLPDIDNNEVLVDVELGNKARSSSGASPRSSTAGTTKTTTTTTTSSSSSSSTTDATSSSAASSTSTTEAATPTPSTTTTTTPRPAGSFSRFLSDIIQIPIAVMRSVGVLLSNTFSVHLGSHPASETHIQPVQPVQPVLPIGSS